MVRHMMTRLSLVAFLVALAVPALADVPKKYTSATMGFTAIFPYSVQEKIESDGSGTAAGSDPQGIMYMVGVVPSDAETQKKPVKEQLDNGIAGAVAKVNGTIAKQKDVKLRGWEGREAEINLSGGHAIFRFYIVGPKAYMIGVVHKDGTKLPESPQAFFASFSVTPPPKAPKPAAAPPAPPPKKK
jgi:hypothetical protein